MRKKLEFVKQRGTLCNERVESYRRSEAPRSHTYKLLVQRFYHRVAQSLCIVSLLPNMQYMLNELPIWRFGDLVPKQLIVQLYRDMVNNISPSTVNEISNSSQHDTAQCVFYLIATGK